MQDIFSLEYLRSLTHETPFFLYSKEKVLQNLSEYKESLPPNTEICYALKANSERDVLATLFRGGASFEVASKYELGFLQKVGVPGSRMVYGTAVKPEDHINDFVAHGVDRFAFDSEEELQKIVRRAPGSRVYVRTLVDDRSDSVFHMSEKFGASLHEAADLMIHAKELGLVPYGISFNVGSQAKNQHAWERGARDVFKVMNELLKKGIRIEVVNLGGGFPHSYQDNDGFRSIKEIASHIHSAFEESPYPVKLIVEPGRGLTANSYVLIVTVIAKNIRENGHWLFLDAGVYNALLEALASQGTTKYRVAPLKSYGKENEEYIVTGPTGDNLDVIGRGITLPTDIEVGDRIVIYDTGAYTFPLMTSFNGFPKPITFSV
jgi:ornithine decarboxylase